MQRPRSPSLDEADNLVQQSPLQRRRIQEEEDVISSSTGFDTDEESVDTDVVVISSSTGSDSDGDPYEVPGYPRYVVREGFDDVLDTPSDDEEFNSLDDLYSITDSDRRPKALLPLPVGFEGLSLESKVRWALQVVYDKVQAMLGSECIKRRTIAKLSHRLESKDVLEQPFYDVFSSLFPSAGHVLDAREGESFTSVYSRLMGTSVLYRYKLLQACALYASYNQTSIVQCDQLCGGAPMCRQMDDCRVATLAWLRRTLCESTFPRFAERVAAPLDETIDAYERAELFDHLTVRFRQDVSDLTDKCAKLLYRFSLYELFEAELNGLKSQMRMVKLMFVRKGLLVREAETLILRYLVPDYRCYPVRGPFVRGFYGSSCISALYGPVANPNYWYCSCSVYGSKCGHTGISLFRVRCEYYHDDEAE